MLESFRITKYNPKNRNEKGHYLVDEWTSFSDVWKNVTFEEYITIENKYIECVEKCMQIVNIKNLVLKKYEENTSFYLINQFWLDEKVYNSLHENINVCINDIPTVIRAILRGNCWWKLSWDKNFFIHFGWDYYMFIGFKSSKKLKQKVLNLNIEGLYIEEFRSPYLKSL